MSGLVGAWLLGLILGARHAFEPDHLAAMATLVASERPGALLGALWGAGHTATLLLAGGALVLCRAHMPTPLANGLELAVALMLLGLGARSLWWASRRREEPPHVHPRPFFVGMAHGLAGSGALTALALATMPSPSTALIYLLLFALGSVSAMAAASGLLGWPLSRMSRSLTGRSVVAAAAGALSVVTGLVWAWRTLS
jgi:hypothetical protein